MLTVMSCTGIRRGHQTRALLTRHTTPDTLHPTQVWSKTRHGQNIIVYNQITIRLTSTTTFNVAISHVTNSRDLQLRFTTDVFVVFCGMDILTWFNLIIHELIFYSRYLRWHSQFSFNSISSYLGWDSTLCQYLGRDSTLFQYLGRDSNLFQYLGRDYPLFQYLGRDSNLFQYLSRDYPLFQYLGTDSNFDCKSN